MPKPLPRHSAAAENRLDRQRRLLEGGQDLRGRSVDGWLLRLRVIFEVCQRHPILEKQVRSLLKVHRFQVSLLGCHDSSDRVPRLYEENIGPISKTKHGQALLHTLQGSQPLAAWQLLTCFWSGAASQGPGLGSSPILQELAKSGPENWDTLGTA